MQKKIPVRTRATVIGIHSAARSVARALWIACHIRIAPSTLVCPEIVRRMDRVLVAIDLYITTVSVISIQRQRRAAAVWADIQQP
jgi:hypothetical protein